MRGDCRVRAELGVRVVHDALDLAFGVDADSRLGCQVKLGDSCEGMRIRLTSTMESV